MIIADLHADLLCYLGGEGKRTINDPQVRCSLPQLTEGNVRLQILPVFVENSSRLGSKQIEKFRSLPSPFQIIQKNIHLTNKIGVLLAFENGSGFCSEEDDLKTSLYKLEDLEEEGIKIAYISLTWNGPNRFGGGAHSQIGLQKDGETLLSFMHQRRIAIDLSHASDPLAFDILKFIDKKQLDIPVIASHSNFRAITDVPRNLPDVLAREITDRKGIIGFNFVRSFVGFNSLDYFTKQLDHALKLKVNLAFGADFFFGDDVPPERRKKPEEWYFPGFDNATCYKKVIDLWSRSPLLNQEILEKICYKNLQTFLETQIL